MNNPSLEEILINVYSLSGELLGVDGVEGVKEAKAQIIQHFLACVPEKKKMNKYWGSEDERAEEFFKNGFNQCRQDTINNIKGAK